MHTGGVGEEEGQLSEDTTGGAPASHSLSNPVNEDEITSNGGHERHNKLPVDVLTGTTTDGIAAAVNQREDSKAVQASSEAGIEDANSQNLTDSVALAGSNPTAGAGPPKSDEKPLVEQGPVAAQAPPQESGGCSSTAAVLKDGRAMVPAFPTGGVSCHDISTTSVRVTWPKVSDKKYPVYAYRVCTAEVGSGFEVTYGEAPSHEAEAVIVGLKPGKAYQFLVASISAERMLVPGSSIVSDPVQLPKAEYEKAWFFEGGEDDIKWTAFEGLGPENVGAAGGGGAGAGGGSTALDDIRCSPSPTRCFTGLRSLCLVVPAGLAGGAYVDTPVKEGWLYVVRAKVFHEEEGGGGGGGAGAEAEGAGRKGSRLAMMTGWTAGRKGSKSNVTTRLVLWDMRDGKETSAPAVKTGEWEALECQIIPFRSEHLRVAIQSGGEGRESNVYVDAVELLHGGATPAERAISAAVDLMDEPRPMPSKVLVRVESARNVRAADTLGTSDPFVKVFVRNAEVHRTKVIPMTLSPVWDETFFLSLETTGGGDTNAPGLNADGDGIRFEIWDHDLHGQGDYLGEVCLTSGALKVAPPHRVEHKAVKDPVRGAGDIGERTATEVVIPKLKPARTKRGGHRGGGGGGGGMGAVPPPTILALAIQVSWPKDPESAEGKLVRTLQDENGLLSTRVNALKELSMAALRAPRNIEDAAKAKILLLRSRAAEAAVWVLADTNFLEDACRLLMGLVQLGHDAGHSEAGFGLCRRLRLFVLQLSPAVVAVRCLRASVGPPEILLELLAKLYVGQQAALHEDVVNFRGFFYSLVLHIDTSAPAQALLREISGGARELPDGLVALFRRYRTRIPPLPGLWRSTMLQKLSAEEAHPPDLEGDDLEANEDDHDLNPASRGGNREGEPSLPDRIRANLTVALVAVPPLFKAVAGGRRVGAPGSCEQPVGTVLVLDGLVLMCAVLGGGCFRINRRRFSVLAGTWLFPTLFLAFLLHLGLVAGLLVSLARVDSVEAGGGQGEDDGKVTCSSGTFAWGVLFLVLDLLLLVAPPVWWCARCYDRATRSVPAVAATSVLVVPDERPATDAKPVASVGGDNDTGQAI
ncbi:unnamed protein product [Ectocarpus sp. 12 AP-2014]